MAVNFMELMQDSKKFAVDYFFSEKIQNLIRAKGENIKISTPINILQQLSHTKYDLVIVGTAHRNFNVYAEIVQKFKTLIFAHNLNFIQSSKWTLLKNIFQKDVTYRLKLLLKEDLLQAPDVYKKAKSLLIFDETLIASNPNLNLKYLPLFFNKFYKKPQNEIFTMIIPGAVSQKRRDYQKVLDSLKNVKIPLLVIFLGKAKGKELQKLKDFETAKPQNINIQYFEAKVLQDVFEDYMKKADVLWCPVQQQTEFFGVTEFYGKTKISGNIGDAIKYGKPALFPSKYKNSQPFIFTEDDEFDEQISSVSKTNFDFQKNYNKEKIRLELEAVLLSLI